ncbi:tetratricopeptide repeat protein [Pseudoalteromonas ardens]|uniref:Transcriptional regulator n=1 Tax=Pseudoalteromonas rubra TaxID=43658 RepID=A0A0L0EVG8_9GAMM|nr:tetratricopeptide repeat protein [Pseudoalteromonas sp. R96]KNC68380.1 transcriptional regulator [Pseudoalteromonas rubra]MDK1312277.1 tetratricopeptide repeat protein [Pseudoalteromonas sp. R96]
MTDIWFDEHDTSTDHFSTPALLRCIWAEPQWDAQADTSHTLCLLAELEQAVDAICHQNDDKHKCVDALLDAFYTQWLFSGTDQKVPEHLLNNVCYVLKMHSGTSMALALILVHLLERARLNASLAINQGDVLVHIALSDEEGYIIDPSSGHQSWYVIPENGDDKEQEPMELVFGEEAFKLYLAQQKWSFIAAEKFGHALSCVEMLMELLGDDPYERRDRGYLLNQLNCPKMAKDDLQFFVDECPDDPTIELIQNQIAELADHNNILH